jgi:ALG6, ALG8 glycosyltransferase family
MADLKEACFPCWVATPLSCGAVCTWMLRGFRPVHSLFSCTEIPQLQRWSTADRSILLPSTAGQVTVPLAVVAATDACTASDYLFLSTVGNYSLLPLLFTPAEYPIKVLLVSIYLAGACMLLRGAVGASGPLPAPRLERLYLYGLVPLEVYGLLHGWLLGGQLPFLPLLLVSVYCALGILWAWLKMAGAYVRPLTPMTKVRTD